MSSPDDSGEDFDGIIEELLGIDLADDDEAAVAAENTPAICILGVMEEGPTEECCKEEEGENDGKARGERIDTEEEKDVSGSTSPWDMTEGEHSSEEDVTKSSNRSSYRQSNEDLQDDYNSGTLKEGTLQVDDLMNTSTLDEYINTKVENTSNSHVQQLCHLVNSNDITGIKEYLSNEHDDNLVEVCLVPGENGETPVTLAGTLGLLEVLEVFEEAGIWLHGSDAKGYMAIHRAAHNGHSHVVKYLTGKGQWTGVTKAGFTPLHIAASCGNVEIITILLSFVLNIDELTETGWTSLHLASHRGHVTAVQVLLERDADVNLKNQVGCTSLHLGAEEGHIEVIRKLVEYGADVNVMDDSCLSPMARAIQNGQEEAVALLIGLNADLNMKGPKGLTMLHRALSLGWSTARIEDLCQRGANINAQTDTKTTCLLLATISNQTPVIATLLAQGADPNIPDVLDHTPLYVATQHRSEQSDVVKVLLEHGSNVNFRSNKGSSPLYAASKRGYLKTVSLLLDKGASVSLAQKAGWTPLHIATQFGHTEVAKKLLAAGADPSAADKEGRTPLAVAAHNKDDALIKLFRPKCDDPIALYKVAKLGNYSLTNFLRVHGYNFQERNIFGWTAMHYACQDGHLMAVKSLLRVGTPVSSFDSDGNTPLHFAVLHGHLKVVGCLLEFADIHIVNAPNKRGTRCLSIAVQNGNTEMATMLIHCGASINFIEGDSGFTPLFHAINVGGYEVVDLLLKFGADANYMTPSSLTPLLFAVTMGHARIAERLLKSGAQHQAEFAHNGYTCLHIAAEAGMFDVVLELVIGQADVNKKTPLGKTAIHLAAEEGHQAIVEALLSAGARLSLIGEDELVTYSLAKHKEIWEVIRLWALRHPHLIDQHHPAPVGSRRSSGAHSPQWLALAPSPTSPHGRSPVQSPIRRGSSPRLPSPSQGSTTSFNFLDPLAQSPVPSRSTERSLSPSMASDRRRRSSPGQHSSIFSSVVVSGASGRSSSHSPHSRSAQNSPLRRSPSPRH